MNVIFNVDYQTRFGEDIVLNVALNGSWNQYRMGTVDGSRWSYRLSMAEASTKIDYYYSVDYAGQKERQEWREIGRAHV